MKRLANKIYSVDGYTFKADAIQVNFSGSTRPVFLPIAIVESMLTESDGLVDIGMSYVDTNGELQKIHQKITFDEYMQNCFEHEAIAILTSIIYLLKLIVE